MANEPAGARARGVGAVARGDKPRRLALWWWLVGLLLLAIIAGVLIAVLGSGKHHHKHAKAGANAPADAPGSATLSSTTGNAAVTPGQSSTTAGSGAAAGLPAAGEVGGDGIAVKPATGRLAPAGSVGAVLFAEAGISLDQPARAVIATAVKEIQARHSTTVKVIGFTDSIGNAKANRSLSLERARQVITALRGQLDASATKFTAQALGQTHPVAPDTTARGRQLDRRVEIFASR